MPIDMKAALSSCVTKEEVLAWLAENYRMALLIHDYEEAARLAFAIMAVDKVGKE